MCDARRNLAQEMIRNASSDAQIDGLFDAARMGERDDGHDLLAIGLIAALPADHDTVPPTFDPDAVAAILDRLDNLLATADFEVGASFRASSSLLRAALGDAVSEFETPMREHDYPAALEALRAVRARQATQSPHEAA